MRARSWFLLLVCIGLVGCSPDKTPVLAVTQQVVDVDSKPTSLETGLAAGTLVVSCFDSRSVDLLDLSAMRVVKTMKVLNGPHRLIADPVDESIYCLHTRENAIAILAGNPLDVLQKLGTGNISLAGGALRPGRDELWICDGMSGLHVFQTGKTLKLKDKFNTGRYPQQLAFTRDGKSAFVTLKGENAVALVDAGTGQEQARIPVGIYPQDILLSGSTICVSNFGSDNVSLIDTVTLKERIRIPVRGNPSHLSSLGKTLWVSCEDSYRVVAIDTTEGRVIGSIKTGFYPGAIKALDNGALVVADPEHRRVVLMTPVKAENRQ
jgi:YVTN family beta-propeller protein